MMIPLVKKTWIRMELEHKIIKDVDTICLVLHINEKKFRH